MRLLVVAPHFAPRFEGGTEVVARAQARALRDRGHEVRVLAGCDTPHAGADEEHDVVDGLPVTFLPRHAHETYDLLLERPRLRALAAAAAEGVDAVHLHGWATLAGDLVQVLAAQRPVVVSLHDLFVSCPRFFRLPPPDLAASGLRCPPAGDVEPCVRCVTPDAPGVPAETLAAGLQARSAQTQAELDAAAAVVLPSAAQRDRLAGLVRLEPARTHVVPHGLCREIPSEGAASAWASEAGVPLRVLFLGNLARAKGVLDLAAGAARAAAGGRALELVFAGGSVEPDLERSLRETAGAASVRMLGRFQPDTLHQRLAALGGVHLAVLPSRATESYGLVVDETLALGLPTWVSDRGAPQERVGDAGRVLPAADPEALGLALAEAYDDPALLGAQRAAIPAHLPDADAAAERLERLLVPAAPSPGSSDAPPPGAG